MPLSCGPTPGKLPNLVEIMRLFLAIGQLMIQYIPTGSLRGRGREMPISSPSFVCFVLHHCEWHGELDRSDELWECGSNLSNSSTGYQVL